MKVQGIDLTGLMGSIAAKLAHIDAEEQAKFFNVFCKELTHACGTRFTAELQLAYVSKDITDETKELLQMLGVNNDD